MLVTPPETISFMTSLEGASIGVIYFFSTTKRLPENYKNEEYKLILFLC